MVVVGDDVAFFVLFHSGFVEAETLDFGGAADGPEEAVEVDGGAVGVCFVGVMEAHPSGLAVYFLDLGL